MRFGPQVGRYMMHCHNLVHEDHDMMVQFEVGAAGHDPIEADRPKHQPAPELHGDEAGNSGPGPASGPAPAPAAPAPTVKVKGVKVKSKPKRKVKVKARKPKRKPKRKAKRRKKAKRKPASGRRAPGTGR
jgi:hypothetical protein